MSNNQRIRLADGKYCYSGPNCKWHSPSGVASARRELDTAINKVLNSSSYEELASAKEALQEANARYDATSDGIEALKTAIADTDDTLEKANLQSRLNRAKTRLDEVEKEQEALWSQTNNSATDFSNFMNTEHSYKVPTFETKQSANQPFPITYGSNYNPELSTTQTATAIRQELKEAQKKGFLPTDVEYKLVKTGGNSYYISIRGLKDADTHPRAGYTPAARELSKRVTMIGKSFTYDASALQADYVQRSMTIYSKIESDEDRESRVRDEKRKAERARLAPLVKTLKEPNAHVSIHTDFSESKTLADGRKFSKVDNEEAILAVLSEDSSRVQYLDLRDKTEFNRSARRYELVQLDPSKYSFRDLRKYLIK